jgi:hypothetical protein
MGLRKTCHDIAALSVVSVSAISLRIQAGSGEQEDGLGSPQRRATPLCDGALSCSLGEGPKLAGPGAAGR